MFYYIDQPGTLSFPIGLVKTKPDFIIRSVETGFGRQNYRHIIKGCKPDDFEPHNSLKLSFANIWGLRSSFVECESFLESNSPDIHALCDNLGWLN